MVVFILILGLALLYLIAKRLTQLNNFARESAKQAAMPKRSPNGARLAAATGDGPPILIVSHDARLNNLFQKYLKKNGFSVASVVDATEARDLFKGVHFDATIYDATSPGKIGFEQVAELKEDFQAPILMLVHRGESEGRVAGQGNGPDAFLQKPFEPNELLEHLASLRGRIRVAPVH